MTQQIINIGAAPNDGEGDNLRTAFDKVNDNFSNVWAQGPVDSNVRIQGNIISTLQVNQDLALSPNGTGNVRLNNNTIPGANNTWFLGSVTNRWRGLYVGNITANNLSVSGIVDLSGDVTVGGNLTVVGNTIQIGNITTDTKTIQLANTATTDSAANGSGVTVGANDDIATLLYDSANNVWTTNIGVSVGGPITGTSLAVSSATVYGNIAAVNGNFTGNVTANYFSGNGSQLTDIKANVIISNTAPAVGNGVVWWNSVDGRAYIKYNSQFIDLSPSLIPDPTTYVGNVVFDDMTIENVGNVLPGTSNTYSLGSAGFQWKDLWLSGNISAPGNIIASLYIGDGGLLSNVSSVTQSNVAPTSPTDKTLWWDEVSGRLYVWYTDDDGSQWVDAAPAGVDFQNISSNVIPSSTATYSLGNTVNRWTSLYLTGNLESQGANVLTISASTANISSTTTKLVEFTYAGTFANTIIPDWNNGTVQTFTLTNNFILDAPINLPTGGTMSLIIKQDEVGNRAMTPQAGQYIFASNVKTLTTTANATDMINIFNAGNVFMAALTLDYT
jgi:hypothetical protein